jgi:uroporphyrinogen-III synthase
MTSNAETTDGPLAGFTIGVTAERRRDEMAALLRRRGARVVIAPTIAIVPLADDTALRAATEACIRLAPDIVVATTGIGFRGWVEAAEGWGLGERLRATLAGAQLLARGPKPCGAIRAAGLTEGWAAPTESSDEVLRRLLEQGIAGRRVALQEHGGPQPAFVAALHAAGATVVEIPVYRWTLPADVRPARRLIDQVLAGQIDALTFTSAPAARALLELAGPDEPELLRRLRTTTMAACVGPVTAAPLEERGVPVTAPARYRLGALIKTVTDELPGRAVRLRAGGSTLEIRGHAVVVDGELRPLAPASMAILSVLAERPGAVVHRDRLAALLPRGNDGNAIDTAMARLRSALDPGKPIETVTKRGYRLRVDEG